MLAAKRLSDPHAKHQGPSNHQRSAASLVGARSSNPLNNAHFTGLLDWFTGGPQLGTACRRCDQPHIRNFHARILHRSLTSRSMSSTREQPGNPQCSEDHASATTSPTRLHSSNNIVSLHTVFLLCSPRQPSDRWWARCVRDRA